LTLYEIEADDTIKSNKAPIVRSALEVADLWKSHSPPDQPMSPYDEVHWFMLRFAEANITERSLRLQDAKEMFERNLRDDPATTDAEMLNIIRRWHLKNLLHWAGSVVKLAVRDGRIRREDHDSRMQTLSNALQPNGIISAMSEIFSQHAEQIASLKTGDYLAAALDLEKEAASNFGSLARSIIDSPMFDVFADLKEAPSSTTSTGWENLAELHMFQYGLAMKSPDGPDYKKGLAHLQEWWKLHQGVSMWKQDQVWGLLKLATCYHGVGQLVEAGREIIKCIQIGQRMGPTDCMDGVVENAHRHIYQEIVKLTKLDIFLDPNILVSKSPAIAALSLKERLQLCEVMQSAHKVKRLDDELEELREAMERAFAPRGLGLGGQKDRPED
jgi:hypothetical protein